VWKKENGFKCYRYANTKPINSYSSINFQVISELFDQRIDKLDEAKIDDHLQKIRLRVLEQQLNGYRSLLRNLNLNEESSNNDSIRPQSFSCEVTTVHSNLKPFGQTNRINAAVALILPFDPSELEKQAQITQKQHVIMQFILDSRKSDKDIDGFLQD